MEKLQSCLRYTTQQGKRLCCLCRKGGGSDDVTNDSMVSSRPHQPEVPLKEKALTAIRPFVPVLTWAPQLTREVAVRDCIGGFIAGVMIVPTCLSWASLAGLPLNCGLAAALFASFSYGTFGQCAVLSLGPVAEITTLLISISGIPVADREKVFQSFGVQVGILSVVLSFIDGGKVIKMIFAKAVGDGYTCAAALLAISVQVKVMFNVPAPPATLLQDVIITTVKALAQNMSVQSVYCFLLFLVYCLYLVYVKKIKRLPLWIPHQLIVVVVSTTITWMFKLNERWNLSIVRDIPSGLSLPSFPPFDNVVSLAPYVLTITMISFVQMYVIAQRVMPDIDPNAELFAGGVTNFIVNIFSGMPVTNSFSCSSVLMEQKVSTPLTAYAAGGVVLVTIVFLTRLGVFYYLPKQALAAIVVASVVRLVDFSSVVFLWKNSRKDAFVWILTFLLTVFGGITIGVLSGIMLSLILVILRVARPRAVSVGFNMTTYHYGDLSKDPELLVYPNILMWRFDAPLFFVNTGFFQERLQKAISAEVRPIDVVLVTCGKVVDIDSAALASLPAIFESVSKYGLEAKGGGGSGTDRSREPTAGVGEGEGEGEPAMRPRKIILTDIHGRLEKVLLATGTLPFYNSAEYSEMSIAQMEASGKFPVVFKKLEDAIAFSQRFISERYGNVDTAPYPNVAFVTDMVVDTIRADTSTFSFLGDQASIADLPAALAASVTLTNESMLFPSGFTGVNTRLFSKLDRLRKISTFTPDRELIGVMGVVRHTELTPKRKKKILFEDPGLLALAFPSAGNTIDWWSPAYVTRSVYDLDAFITAAAQILSANAFVDSSELNRSNWERVLTVMRAPPSDLKIQIKPLRVLSRSGSGATTAEPASRCGSVITIDDADWGEREPVTAALLVVKWGGTLTKFGVSQAQVLGEKLFARFFAAGDLPLQRLAKFTQSLSIVCSDESRVITTALVVTNALTQLGGRQVGKRDIIRDDALMKTLSPVTRKLLHNEYLYFEGLLHIDTVSEARHYFHIPGFRQLLRVPASQQQQQQQQYSDTSDEEYSEGSGSFNTHSGSLYVVPREVEEDEGSSNYHSNDDGGYHRYAPFGGVPRPSSPAVGAATAAQASPSDPVSFEEKYHTPIEVLRELESLLDYIVHAPLPTSVLKESLSNHETLEELRFRYETLLQNLRGAKRQNRVVRQKRRRNQQRRALAMDDGAGTRTTPEGDQKKDAALEVTGGASSADEDEDVSVDEEEEEGNTEFSANNRSRGDGGGGGGDSNYGASITSLSQRQQHSSPGNSASNRLRTPTFKPDHAATYDVSDVSKLRDYASYDLSYNFPLMQGMCDSLPSRSFATVSALQKTMGALYRVFSITDCMSRVGENVLEGVNSSKRFIIGSLVSSALLRRLYTDYSDVALMDERKGIRELLVRAQKLYMADHSDVRQDVQHFMRIVKQMSKNGNDRQQRLEEEMQGLMNDGGETEEESPEERAFRLRFPFITLPSDEGDSDTNNGTQQQQQRPADQHEQASTRFYFSSYLHVEGLVQCLFESVCVEGFSHPTKEELEAAQQLYMKHLIFKVFRRRNVGFSQAEAVEALRQLPLLFRSDVPYATLQSDLRAALASLYHSMYYVSMEVYLSVGDTDAADTTAWAPRDPMEQEEGEAQAGSPNSTTSPAHPDAPADFPARSPLRSDAGVDSSGSGSGVVMPVLSPNSRGRSSTAPPPLYRRGSRAQREDAEAASPRHHSHSPRRHKRHGHVATVMKTPEAGRKAALVKAMKNRASSVTPMKRIHEGLSLADFKNLVLEAESAAQSQQTKKT